MYASYYDSAEGCTVSRKRAQRMIERFPSDDATWEAFVADIGEYATYDAQAVLRWLGY